jgi:tRNA A-37 threonylcarbamoyl transferase component Bud32
VTVLPEIDSRFEVIAKLGEGGMGTVYKVRHRSLDEIQIVKTMQAHFSSNEALRNRFINEARRGMRLRHPHIAAVHDFAVCADGTGYIVMEYVHGLNLRDMLATRGPLPLPMIGEIAVQTLDALGYLHSEKFVHRDISPDNLMVQVTDGRPFVKLIDLGISKSLESGQTMTATGQFLGKVQYAAPEAFGGQLDGRSDLYSFGVVMFNLLTNADPFAGETPRQIISAQLFQPPRRFEDAAPDVPVPEAIQRVVYRALEKEPDKRYADAGEFIAAVEEAFDIHDARPVRLTRPASTESDAIATPPIDRTQIATTFVPAAKTTVIERRPRTWRRWAVVTAIAVVILGVVGFVLWQRAEAARIAAYGKFYAVVIGESHYRRFPELPTAADDARAVGDLLESKYGFTVTRLYDKPQQQILDALRGAAKHVTPNDNLLIFYAGHGSIKAGKGYWHPVDDDLDAVHAITPALMKDALIDQPSRRTLILADSCYSGALAPALPTTSRNKRSRIVISSGGMDPVLDSADGHHSIFTRALLEVLSDPRQKVMDVQTIFGPIREKVIDAAHRAGTEQKPQLAVLAEVGDEGGTFFFVRR